MRQRATAASLLNEPSALGSLTLADASLDGLSLPSRASALVSTALGSLTPADASADDIMLPSVFALNVLALSDTSADGITPPFALALITATLSVITLSDTYSTLTQREPFNPLLPQPALVLLASAITSSRGGC